MKTNHPDWGPVLTALLALSIVIPYLEDGGHDVTDLVAAARALLADITLSQGGAHG